VFSISKPNTAHVHGPAVPWPHLWLCDKFSCAYANIIDKYEKYHQYNEEGVKNQIKATETRQHDKISKFKVAKLN